MANAAEIFKMREENKDNSFIEKTDFEDNEDLPLFITLASDRKDYLRSVYRNKGIEDDNKIKMMRILVRDCSKACQLAFEDYLESVGQEKLIRAVPSEKKGIVRETLKMKNTPLPTIIELLECLIPEGTPAHLLLNNWKQSQIGKQSYQPEASQQQKALNTASQQQSSPVFLASTYSSPPPKLEQPQQLQPNRLRGYQPYRLIATVRSSQPAPRIDRNAFSHSRLQKWETLSDNSQTAQIKLKSALASTEQKKSVKQKTVTFHLPPTLEEEPQILAGQSEFTRTRRLSNSEQLRTIREFNEKLATKINDLRTKVLYQPKRSQRLEEGLNLSTASKLQKQVVTKPNSPFPAHINFNCLANETNILLISSSESQGDFITAFTNYFAYEDAKTACSNLVHIPIKQAKSSISKTKVASTAGSCLHGSNYDAPTECSTVVLNCRGKIIRFIRTPHLLATDNSSAKGLETLDKIIEFAHGFSKIHSIVILLDNANTNESEDGKNSRKNLFTSCLNKFKNKFGSTVHKNIFFGHINNSDNITFLSQPTDLPHNVQDGDFSVFKFSHAPFNRLFKAKMDGQIFDREEYPIFELQWKWKWQAIKVKFLLTQISVPEPIYMDVGRRVFKYEEMITVFE